MVLYEMLSSYRIMTDAHMKSTEVICTELYGSTEQICICSALQIISRSAYFFCPLNNWQHADMWEGT